jgi:hypothetical protein
MPIQIVQKIRVGGFTIVFFRDSLGGGWWAEEPLEEAQFQALKRYLIAEGILESILGPS